MCTVTPHLRDTHLIRTPHYYGQFALSLGKESPYIFSKFSLKTSPPPNLWGARGEGRVSPRRSAPPPGVGVWRRMTFQTTQNSIRIIRTPR